MTNHQNPYGGDREARPGELCSCGTQAVVIFETAKFGDVGYCGVVHGGRLSAEQVLPVEEFVDPEGETYSLNDLGGGEASITSTRSGVIQPERVGPTEEVTETFRHWRSVLADGNVPIPESHRALREMMEAGEEVPEVHLGLEMVLDWKVRNFGRAIGFGRRTAMAYATGWTIPRTVDHRTPEEQAADAARLHQDALWGLELLEDDEVADWYLAAQDPEEVEAERAQVAEDLDVEQRPWAVKHFIAERPERCGFTGETFTGPGVKLAGRGWIGKEVADVEDYLVFSIDGLRKLAETYATS